MNEGFSIREYVSGMRSIDVVKCWPLNDDTDQQAIKSLLSPITVKKFTWWSTFLLQQNEKQDHNSKSTLKGKLGKPPKERSIVELFAVAPQVEKVDDDGEEEEEEVEGAVSNSTTREEINWGVKKKRDSKKNKDILLSELRRKPMKSKKKNLHLSSVISNKCQGSHSKLQLQYQDKATRNPSCDSENDFFDCSSIHKRKPSPQHSHADNMSLKSTDLMLMEENTNHRLAASGIILNNHEKESSIEQQPQCSTVHENYHCNKADKHLNLFENERKKSSLSVECSKFQKDCGLFTEDVTGKVLSGPETIGIEDLGTPDLISPPVCFKDYMGKYDELSGSDEMSNSEERANAMGQSSIESTGYDHSHPFRCEPFPYLAPQQLLQTLFSLPTICGERIINGLDKDFVGLPLNSRGGLIASNSSSNADFNQTMKSSIPITLHDRSYVLENALHSGFNDQSDLGRWDCRTFSKDRFHNPFLVERYVEENPLFVIPSRSDTTNHCNRVDLELFSKSDPSFYSENSTGKEANKGEKIQPTMRLMGKEFLVDGRSFHGYGEENIWKDKQIIDELPYGNRSIDNIMIHDCNQQSLERLEETFSHPSEFIIDPGLESRNTSSPFDYQTSLMQQNGFVRRKLHGDWNLNPKVPSGSFSGDPAVICEYATASYQAAHPYMSSNAIQVENQHNKSNGPRSVIRFPFMHPDLEGHVGYSLNCSSSMNRFDIFGNGISSGNSPCLNHQSMLAETKHQTTESSVSFRPQAFLTNDIFSSGTTFRTPAAPVFHTQLAQHVIVPCHPGYPPEIKRYGDQKNTRNRIMSNIGIIRGCEHGKKSKRQRSSAPNVPLMTFNLPSFGVQEGPQVAITEPSTYNANYECGAQNVGRTELIKPLTEAVSNIRLCEPENLKNISRF